MEQEEDKIILKQVALKSSTLTELTVLAARSPHKNAKNYIEALLEQHVKEHKEK